MCCCLLFQNKRVVLHLYLVLNSSSQSFCTGLSLIVTKFEISHHSNYQMILKLLYEFNWWKWLKYKETYCEWSPAHFSHCSCSRLTETPAASHLVSSSPAELRHRAAVAQRQCVCPCAASRGGEEGVRAIAHQLHGSPAYTSQSLTHTHTCTRTHTLPKLLFHLSKWDLICAHHNSVQR